MLNQLLECQYRSKGNAYLPVPIRVRVVFLLDTALMHVCLEGLGTRLVTRQASMHVYTSTCTDSTQN